MTQPATGSHAGPGDVAATAGAVVAGGGAVGAWCACFLRRAGLDRVIVVERDTLGCGASSRAAGIVRAQGGTDWAGWKSSTPPSPGAWRSAARSAPRTGT